MPGPPRVGPSILRRSDPMADLAKLFGTNEPPASPRRVAAGSLSADFVSGNLRSIRFSVREVLRAIAYVVRDRDWGTYDPPIENLGIEEAADRFAIRYDGSCRAPDGAILRFRARIEGASSGRLRFEVEAVPDGDFETNRCGFCILHPIEGVAGTPTEVVHADGAIESSRFPDLIEPWQPFKSMRSISHEVAPGLRATCRMEGDTFEMEDQRAWSDASYKTYVRPLALPWPYRLESGLPNRQVVTLDFEGTAPAVPSSFEPTKPVEIALQGATNEVMPRFGLAVAPAEAEATLLHLDRLLDIDPQYLLFHFDPLAGHGEADLRRFAAICEALPQAEVALELVVPARGDLDAECFGMAKAVREAGLRLDTIVVGPDVDRQSTPPGSEWPACPPLEDIYAAAARAFPGLRMGGGMFSYFTELNRKRIPVPLVDFVTHATCPIVHAADDRSVMETLEAIPFITRSVRAFIGRAPYRLGPTTIGMRQNPYGSRTMPNPDSRRIAMAADDPRGRGLFAAAWLVGYAARLAGSEVEGWCGASFAGPRGLLAGTNEVVPLFQVAKGLAEASGFRRLTLTSTDRSLVDGFAVRGEDDRTLLWLANLTAEPKTVRIPGTWSVSTLDEASFADAASGRLPPALPAGSTIRLAAHAVAFLASRTAQEA